MVKEGEDNSEQDKLKKEAVPEIKPIQQVENFN